ncbi:hypothetical protein [Caulobacter hibisci]|uniref:Uncharacterized protein n=1 Tax=Caulobacter hibisci TaxID=2035993 RepID=A0ABS0SZE4_9CAUL|nr:hypothetical protein [Caulobacter hibisci]MBI1684995.1 hypothetical protein [Caulobacter hibisci]
MTGDENFQSTMTTSKSARPRWSYAFGYGVIFAMTGLLAATALYFLNPVIGLPWWGIVLWPSSVFMLGLSGISDYAAGLWTIAIIASNALLYFLVGVLVTLPVILSRRRLIEAVRRDAAL